MRNRSSRSACRKFLLALIAAFALLLPAAAFADEEAPAYPTVDASNTLIEDADGYAAWRTTDGFAWAFSGFWHEWTREDWQKSEDGASYEFAGDPDPDELEWALEDPITVWILGYSGEAEDLVVPETIDGYPVAEFDASRYGALLADEYRDGEDAAADRVRSLYLPASVCDGYISGVDGENFPNLESIETGEGSEVYFSENGILYSYGDSENYLEAYPPAKPGTSFTVSPEATMTGDFTFKNAKYLKSITIPANQYSFYLSSIEGSAITKVTFLGDDIEIIGHVTPAIQKILVFQSEEDAAAAIRAANIKAASAAKSKLTAKALKKKKAKLTWKKAAGVTGYRIYRATKKTGSYKLVKTSACNSHFTWTDKKLKKGKVYYYKVQPYTVVGGSKIPGKLSAPVKMKAKK
ncbi:MAG: hypothetical protein IJ109_02235 [Firmicutes bacterium]|nr:hypothetical protein [Bacillota bacterium]